MKHISESIIGKRGTRYFTVNDLQNGDIVILREGTPMLVCNGWLRVLRRGNALMDRNILNKYDNNLTCKDPLEDIMIVYRFKNILNTGRDYRIPELLAFIRNMENQHHKEFQIVFERK